MTKRILIIILFILVAIGLALLLYFTFFAQTKKPASAPSNVPLSGKLPVTQATWEKMTVQERAAANLPLYQWKTKEKTAQPIPPVIPQKPVVGQSNAPATPEISSVASGGKTWTNLVSSVKVTDATLAPDGQNSVYYDQTDGKFYQTDSNGQKRLFSNQTFYNVQNVNWSPTKDKAILQYPDGFQTMYDFAQNKQYTLPLNWKNISWDPSGEHIAFKNSSQYEENNWLAVARPDGTGAKAIEPMGQNADKVVVSYSPGGQVIAFSDTGEPQGFNQAEIYLIGQHGENFKSLTVDGRDFEPIWAPQGGRIAYSVYTTDSGFRPVLYLVDADGDNIGQNHLNTHLNTWAHKCTFNDSGTNLYCAVPRDLPQGSGLIPDVAGNTQDDFYRINVQTGAIDFLAEDAMGGSDVSKIYLSKDEGTLYFIDKYSGVLKYLKLK